MCGQCFKIVRLKDEFSELQDYYSMMFADISHFEIAEEDMAINLTSFFGDRPQPAMQTLPGTNVYIHVNSDEADRILVDPAYKLERLKEAHEKLYAMHEAFKAVDKQLAPQRITFPETYSRENYETWYEIERSIRKFDRLFNKVEKFNGRKFSDPDNHERREKRMTERKQKRWVENYTYFFGGLTEEEQQYRDYFETDLENDPEDDYIEGEIDKYEIASQPHFNPKRYDFLQDELHSGVIENIEDVVEDKIFKYKYRLNADGPELYGQRMSRVLNRFLERAQHRDASIDQDLYELYSKDAVTSGIP